MSIAECSARSRFCNLGSNSDRAAPTRERLRRPESFRGWFLVISVGNPPSGMAHPAAAQRLSILPQAKTTSSIFTL